MHELAKVKKVNINALILEDFFVLSPMAVVLSLYDFGKTPGMAAEAVQSYAKIALYRWCIKIDHLGLRLFLFANDLKNCHLLNGSWYIFSRRIQ